MDIACACDIQSAKISSQIQVAVAKKAIDNARLQGNAALKLLQTASSVGKSDPLAAAATGLGANLDIRA